MSLRKILEELCRKSHQAKGTDSYYPFIDLAHQQILALIPKKIRCKCMNAGQGQCRYCERYNEAISEITHNLTKDV